MYCKNCGNVIQQGAAVCTNCGVPVGQGMNYCNNCGNPVQPGQAVCVSCGFATGAAVKAPAIPGAKSRMAAGLLGIFLGAWGVHNFYLGYTEKAVAQLVLSIVGILLACFTYGIINVAVSIWGLIEGIMILCGSINTDADGIPLTD